MEEARLPSFEPASPLVPGALGVPWGKKAIEAAGGKSTPRTTVAEGNADLTIRDFAASAPRPRPTIEAIPRD